MESSAFLPDASMYHAVGQLATFLSPIPSASVFCEFLSNISRNAQSVIC